MYIYIRAYIFVREHVAGWTCLGAPSRTGCFPVSLTSAGLYERAAIRHMPGILNYIVWRILGQDD